MPKDKTQLLRLIFIDKKIREGMKTGKLANCSSIAAEYEVSGKSILRDIDYLKNQRDAPIAYNPKQRGYFYTEENYALPAININESDLFAICIAEKALKQHENTPIYRKLVSMFQKIEQSLPEKITISPSWIDTRLSVIQDRHTEIDSEIWEIVAKGLHKNRAVEIRYQKPGTDKPAKKRTLLPYHVVNFQGEWYVIGYCRKREKVLTFAVSRIREAVLLDESFSVPDEFQHEQFAQKRFGIFSGSREETVRIQFYKEIAPYILERKWHLKQKISKEKNGGVILSFPADHLLEVKRWVLSWGNGAEVLAPDELITMVKEELADTLRLYS